MMILQDYDSTDTGVVLPPWSPPMKVFDEDALKNKVDLETGAPVTSQQNIVGNAPISETPSAEKAIEDSDTIKINIEGSVGSVFAKTLIAAFKKDDQTAMENMDDDTLKSLEITEKDYDHYIYLVDTRNETSSVLGDLSIALDKNRDKVKLVVFESLMNLNKETKALIYNYAYENSDKVIMSNDPIPRINDVVRSWRR